MTLLHITIRLNLRLLLVLIAGVAAASTILLLVAIAGLSNDGCFVFFNLFCNSLFLCFALPVLIYFNCVISRGLI